MKVKVESEYLKSETKSPVKGYPLSVFLTLVVTWPPIWWRQEEAWRGWRPSRSPLCAPSEGMLRTPGREPRETAPRNKCRVPWQRREFPGPGDRKRPPPGSRLLKQNLVPRPEEQNGRKATPNKGAGRLENLGNSPFSFLGNEMPVGRD